MQIVGYMILLVFYLCYFIKMFQQRKQGIQTDHMGKGKQGIQKKIEIMMKGATIATFIIEILSIYLNTDLITDGIYQISRNPAFLGFNLVYLGMCLMFFNTILLIISLLAMMMFHLQIKYVEEPFLKQEFK